MTFFLFFAAADWFDSLERCFRWSNRIEQKAFDPDMAKKVAETGIAPTHTSQPMPATSKVVAR